MKSDQPRRRAAGQGLAEFALALPIFLVIVLGLFDLGRGVVAYNSITNAAREAARLAIVNQDVAKVEARAFALAIAGGDNQIVTVEFRAAGPNADPLQNGPCTPISIGCLAYVTFTSEFQPVTPVVGSLVGPLTLNAQSVLPIEYACPNQAITNSDNCPKQP